MCRTRVEAETKGEIVGVEKKRSTALFFSVHARVCVRMHWWIVDAQYTAVCAYRRIGRPRGDVTALRRYNYLRALL